MAKLKPNEVLLTMPINRQARDQLKIVAAISKMSMRRFLETKLAALSSEIIKELDDKAKADA